MNPLRLPQIPTADKKMLEAKIKSTDVSQAIRALARNKAPGSDGFPLEYYNTFAATLVP